MCNCRKYGVTKCKEEKKKCSNKKCCKQRKSKLDCNAECTGKNCDECVNTTNCTSLTYERIFEDNYSDVTNTITHQFEWQVPYTFISGTQVLDIEREYQIPIDTFVEGTELYPDAPVYGYNDDGSLDLTGGKEKTYNSDYKQFELRYHGALEAKLPYGGGNKTLGNLFPNTVKTYFDRVVSYFTNRGYTMPAPDVTEKFKDQYIWQYPEGQNQYLTNGLYVAIKPIWKSEKCRKIGSIPKYIDLHASVNPSKNFVLDTYQPDLSQRQNGHGYPIRIPITTKFCDKFQTLYNVTPIAYYDEKCGVLTIHIPENSVGYLLTNYQINIDNSELSYTELISAFNGSFRLLKKSESGFICADFNDFNLFAQVSENVSAKSITITNDVREEMETSWPLRSAILAPDDNTIYYTGIVLPKMSGGTSAFDVFVYPTPDIYFSSFLIPLDPLQYPASKYYEKVYAEGDNPITKVIEQYSVPNTMHLFDLDWSLVVFSLPYDVITAVSSFPENVGTTEAPSKLSQEEANLFVAMHEFVHTSQYSSGTVPVIPAESMATAIELDIKASKNTYYGFRARAFTRAALRLTRGLNTMMSLLSQGSGTALFWYYIQAQFDANMQLQRRVMDILTSETYGPTIKAAQVSNSSDLSINLVTNNTVGGTVSLRQALSELFSLDIREVWNNFSIAAVLYRNNTSIPKQYRVNFPYWIYNTQYAGYQTIYDALALEGIEQYANWWENMDTNQEVFPNYEVGQAVGQTFTQTLPNSYSNVLNQMYTVSFNVPHDRTNITVNITSGEWRITLLQFTSDGTPVGSFIIDGPHTVNSGETKVFNFNRPGDVLQFTSTGNIRLVCAHVSLNGTGKDLAEYFTPEVPSGEINITSN